MTALRVVAVGVEEPLRRAVSQAGIATAAVDAREAALERVGSDACHCLLTPAVLPEGTGFDLAAAAAERVPRLPTVVVGTAPPASVADDAVGPEPVEYVRRDDEDVVPPALVETVSDVAWRFRRQRDRALVGTGRAGPGCVVRDGAISYCTEDAAEVLDAEASLHGTRLLEHVAEAERGAVRTALRDADEDATTVRFAPAGDRHRTVAATIRREPREGAVVVGLRDVTDRTRRVADLETDSEMLEALLGDVPISIYFKDRQSRHERVSRYITKTDPEEYIRNDEGKVHPHPDDVVGKSDFDLYAPEFAEEAVADDRRVMEDGEPIVNRIEAGTTNLGEDLYTSTTKAPRYDETGEIVGLVGVTIDVTDRIRHRKELQRQNERLDEFAEVLTHDLRNPLQIAQGYLETVLEEYDGEAAEETAAALARMESLIDEIRSFVLEGRTVDDPDAVDLEQVAAEAWSTVETGDATLSVDGELYLRADPDRLRRLLENLFRNAVEHGSTSPGSHARQDAVEHGAPDDAALTVRIETFGDGFAVVDDGVGLPEDDADAVFERGFTTSEDGTGFGLAIVRDIAEAHGWSVDASRGEDGGARFAFTGVVRVGESIGQTLTDLS